MADPINLKNILNILFFVGNTVLTYGIGVMGWFGAGTNTELSEKYQTIVTPSGTAFSIWAIIFLFQGIFAFLNVLPRYRSKPMVQDGVSYWYVAVCVAQNGWNFTFPFDVIPVSLVFMFLTWACLMSLVISQYYTPSEKTLEEFWLLRFPFAVHAGWITAALAVNTNVIVVYAEAAAATQLAVGIISLAVLHAISVWVLFGFNKPNYTIACVLAWANGWIYDELQEAKDKITNTFNVQVISGVSYAALSVSFIILSQVAVRATYIAVKAVMTKKETEQNDDEKVSEGSTNLEEP